MKITIQTPVKQKHTDVWRGFTRELFLALAPPFTPVNLLRFDGCRKGDEVHLELNMLLFNQLWCSKITEQEEKDDEIYFVDEGVKLPFFLNKWKHKHRIIKQNDNGAIIRDEIEFETFNIFTDLFVLPAMYLQFAYRQPIYQQWFDE